MYSQQLIYRVVVVNEMEPLKYCQMIKETLKQNKQVGSKMKRLRYKAIGGTFFCCWRIIVKLKT